MAPMPGHEHMHHAMSMPLLPGWLRVVWVVVLGVVLLLHAWHAATMRGQCRWWHTGHTIMAAGMAVMYLFVMVPAVSWVLLMLFTALTVAMAATTVSWWRREQVVNPLWMTATLDMLVMGYMSLPATARPAAVTWLLVTWLGLQTLAWVFRRWERLPLYRTTGEPRPGAPLPLDTAAGDAPAGAGIAGAGSAAPEDSGAPTGTVTTLGAPTATGTRRVGLSGRASIDVALSLAVMAASMGYMLVAM